MLVPISISIIAITIIIISIVVVDDVDDVDHDNYHYCIVDAVESVSYSSMSAAPREYCVRSKTLKVGAHGLKSKLLMMNMSFP